MKRIVVGLTAVAVLAGAVAVSGRQNQGQDGNVADDFSVEVGERNPWTHLRFNNQKDNFQFLIITDRTGGHRAGVFAKACKQINLLQPEFVVSVGDLIEGYSSDVQKVKAEWKEFQGFVGELEMPFFYVAGNHDISRTRDPKAYPTMNKIWQEKFGRRYYHFKYQGVLFLCLLTDDLTEEHKTGDSLSPEQLEYAKKVLAANEDVRWTFVLMHKPIWDYGNIKDNNFLELEKALLGRNYTVFAGHRHHYQKYIRNGMAYYQLATTGGGSRLRGPEYGEFDHVVMVTMKDGGPVLANIMLDGVYPENLNIPPQEESGSRWSEVLPPVYPVRGQLYLDGVPAYGCSVTLSKPGTRYGPSGNVEADGTFTVTSGPGRNGDGAPVGEYTVVVRNAYPDPGKPPVGPRVDIPESYRSGRTSPLKVAVTKDGENRFILEMKR